MHHRKLNIIYVLLTILVFGVNIKASYAVGININPNVKFNINAITLNIEGDINIKGTLQTSNGTITINGDWLNSGLFSPGTSTVNFNSNDITSSQVFEAGAADSFYNLFHSGTGILIPNTGTSPIDVNGSFINSAGTFLTQSRNMNVGGNWSNSGNFLHQNNTITLDGINQSLIGNTTFFNLTKIISSVGTQTLTFDNAAKQTVDNSLTLQGLLNNFLVLRSDSTTQFDIALKTGGQQSLAFLDVKDSNASGGIQLSAVSSVNSGNNTNWSFGSSSSPPTPTPTPSGGSGGSSSPTPTPSGGTGGSSSPTPTPSGGTGGSGETGSGGTGGTDGSSGTGGTDGTGGGSTTTPTPTPTPLPGANVKGNVVDSRFRPVSGIFVDAFDFFKGTWVGSARTDSKGDYTISNLNAGNYKVGIDVSGTSFVEQFFENSDFITASKITLIEFVDVIGINFILSEANFIRGKVTDNSDKPVIGLVVDAFDAKTEGFVNSAFTDGKGNYSITVPPGEYKVAVDTFGTNFLSEFFLEVKTFEDALVVEVTSNSNAENINFVLSTGGEIKGQVTDISDNPVPGIVINIFDAATGKLLNSSKTDNEGNYSVPVSPGRYNVAVEINGTNFKPILRENVVVKADFASPIIDFVLSVANSVKGKVTDSLGEAKPNMFVKAIDSATGEFVNFDISNVDGKYSIPVLQGSYNVVVDTIGTNFLPISKDVKMSNSDVIVDFALTFVSLIRGNVKDSSNNPISGLSVNAFDFDSGIWIAFDNTDKNGDYSIPVAPGTYKVSVDTFETSFAPLIFNNTDWDRANRVNVSEGEDTFNIDFILTDDSFITGKISDGTMSLKDIFVDVLDFDTGTWVNFGKTNEQGTYTVSVQGGVYKVGTFAIEQGFTDEFFEDKSDFDSADRVNVLPGKTESGIDFILTPGGSISGRVTSGASPIEGIEVNAVEFDTNLWINKDMTDSNGEYKISGLPPGKYRIWAFDPDKTRVGGRFVSEFFDDTRSWNKASSVNTKNEKDESDIDFELLPGGTISGNVTGKDNKSLDAVTVEAYEFATGEWANSVKTNISGDYSISLPSNVDYILRAFDLKGTNTTEYFDNVSGWNDATPIRAKTNEDLKNINFSLPDNGNVISGIVVDEKNKPLKGIEINIFDFDTGSWIDSVTTDLNGRYSISVSPGKYRVGALPVKPMLIPQFFNGMSNWDDSSPVFISSLKGVQNINFKLFEGGLISGAISDESNERLAQINVKAFDFESGSWVNESVTDKDGLYRIAVPFGKYRIMITPLDTIRELNGEFFNNASSWNIATPVTVDSKEAVTLNKIKLSKGKSIIGKVVNGNNSPLAGVRIDVFDFDSGFWITTAHTNKDGEYIIKGLLNGEYRVKALPPLESSLAGSFFKDASNWNDAKRVIINSAEVNDINFKLISGGLVAGKITDITSGDPVSGIEVGAFDLDTGNWVNSGITDGSGNYLIKVPIGIYIVRANTSGTKYIGTFFDNTLNIDQVKAVVISFDKNFNADFQLTEGGKINGTATDIDNIGIKGARIDIFDFNTNFWVNNGLTDINGEYSINVPSGTYRIKITAPTGSNFIGEEIKAPVTITAPNEVRIAGIVLSEGRGAIIGTVRDSKGLRLEGIKVNAFDFDTDDLASFDFTDSNGDYSLSVPPGRYRINTFSKGSGNVLVDKLFDDVVTWEDASAVNVSKDVIRTVDFVLDEGASVSGIVRSANDLTPLAGMEVHIFQSDTAVWINSDKTDKDGKYSICVPDGVYRVWTADKRSNFEPQFFNISESFDNAKRIVVSGSDIPGVNFELLTR